MTVRQIIWGLLAIWPAMAGAQSLEIPGTGSLTVNRAENATSYSYPTGAWADGTGPFAVADGNLRTQVWRLDDSDLTTLQIFAPLRQQLTEAGFQVIYECRTSDCGGFDFRYGVNLEQSPQMQVDLNDFRYFAAEMDGTTVVLFVSRSKSTGFIQLTHIDAIDLDTAETGSTTLTAALAVTGIGAALVQQGHVVLNGVTFESGSDTLADSASESLTELAQFLADHPTYKVALVGHTDSSGSLEANIALSKSRAAAVVATLIADYGTNPDQLESAGMGYMSPLTTNQTEQGRNTNRRVEAVLTNTGN